MGRVGDGVEVRDKSIRLSFTLDGKACRETLKTDGAPMAPTPANVKYARRLAAEIRDRIRCGAFNYADYFPASQNATSGRAVTVGEQLGLWLSTQTDKARSTLKGYGVAVEWWKGKVGTKPLKSLKHSDILLALASEPKWTGKTRNNKASVLRQALALALRDGAINSSPIEGLEPATHQRPQPDPFSRDEAEAIIAGMAARYNDQIANYFGFKFFTGLRTSESLIVRWESIDWRREQMLVSDALVLGVATGSTKTNTARVVQLNSRALEYLKAQKAHTFMQSHGLVFPDPRTGKIWTDDEPPREMYWRPLLKKLGIRYRSPYETRHTYATMLLMAGVAPAYGARQLGHSVEMFLRTYSKWIDGGQNALEMDKLETMLAGPAKASATR